MLLELVGEIEVVEIIVVLVGGLMVVWLIILILTEFEGLDKLLLEMEVVESLEDCSLTGWPFLKSPISSKITSNKFLIPPEFTHFI